MPRKKKAIHRKYTPVGRRIATLAKQTELAKVLKLTQQTISKKLRGETAILVADLQRLGKQYEKPVAWFFVDEIRKDLEKVWQAIPIAGRALRSVSELLGDGPIQRG